MKIPLTLKERFDRKLPRVTKHTRQWVRVLAKARRPDSRFVFVVGSQRSGTRLPLQVLDAADDIITFSEGTSPYFTGVLLQPLERVEQLRRRSPFPIVVLKPICETHRVHGLLDRFAGSRAVWIFRHFSDAVNSASIKWHSGREAVRRLSAGELESAGWRAGGLNEQKLAEVRRLYREDMTLHDANAVMWYLRNGLFFDLHADVRGEILLVRYEDLVSEPGPHFKRLFDFIGHELPARFDEGIRPSTSAGRPIPGLDPEIRALCEAMEARLLAHYARAVPAMRV